MGKTLFWIAVFFVVLFASRFLALHAAKKRFREEKAQQAPRSNNPLPSSEQMVRCAHCDVFLPRSEALLTQGETFCNESHAKLGPGRSR